MNKSQKILLYTTIGFTLVIVFISTYWDLNENDDAGAIAMICGFLGFISFIGFILSLVISSLRK